MKKIHVALIITLSLVTALFLAACGGGEESDVKKVNVDPAEYQAIYDNYTKKADAKYDEAVKAFDKVVDDGDNRNVLSDVHNAYQSDIKVFGEDAKTAIDALADTDENDVRGEWIDKVNTKQEEYFKQLLDSYIEYGNYLKKERR